MAPHFKFPSGAEFAFSILDDTDDTTLKNGRPVYDFLHKIGVHTTKTVWAFDTDPENQGPYFAGETLSSPQYRKWVHQLAEQGFEIAFHNATMGSSPRHDTLHALDFIEEEFGEKIRLHCNHGQNRENLYWGADRYRTYIIKKLLSIYSKLHDHSQFEGSNPKSPYFWSDIANDRLSYIRAFTYRKLNGALIPPGRPFHDSSKLTSPVFFNTTDASDILTFNKLVNKRSIDKLRKQKGWAIISTHLGKGFYRNNSLDPDFKKTMEYMTTLPGWFVPVSKQLDFISHATGSHEITTIEQSQMEILHLIDRLKGRLLDPRLY